LHVKVYEAIHCLRAFSGQRYADARLIVYIDLIGFDSDPRSLENTRNLHFIITNPVKQTTERE